MEHVAWTDHPRLRRPVLIAAFEGWNDAGEGATYAARYLARQWSARRFAVLDPEEFFDFSSTRPTVRLDEGFQRQIEWPSTELAAGGVPGGDGDAVILIGTEPQLRWRTFTSEIVEVAGELDVSMVITLGALLAEVPHTRPVPIVGTADDEDLIRRLDLRRSTYQGPTGIVGVLTDATRRAGIPTVSLWATVPSYVPGAPSPKAALALVERVGSVLGITVPAVELAAAARSYEQQLNELVAGDDDMAGYVARLEEAADEGGDDDDHEGLIEEVERYLRDQ
jgi:proteasome assembly chaperone (PAC2) family protein